MILQEIRGKKANAIRWEALKMLDWVKDKEIIDYLFSVKNGLFFSSRSPEQVIEYAKENIKQQKFIDNWINNEQGGK